jgi:prepilin-type N-terminal cleavage/methylation domain-containing protein
MHARARPGSGQAYRQVGGFTLIELIVAVVVVGILAALAIPRFTAASERAKQSEAEVILKQIYTLQQAYFERAGSYTTDLTASGLGAVGWQDPASRLFSFSVATADADGFCANAAPLVAMVKQRSIRASRSPGATDDGAVYDQLDCAGNRLD